MIEVSNAANIKKFKQEISVHDDEATRALYATDASIYRANPLGVIFPENEEHLAKIVKHAHKYNIPVLPRGAGTSLSGQAVSEAIIIDLCRWNNITINDDIATVQPGAVIDHISNASEKYRFGPAPASANRATIGGLLANNGTGVHSIIYGMAVDCLLQARIILADGSIRTFTRNDLDQNDPFTKKILQIVQPHLNSPKWPKTWRNASGLNFPKMEEFNSLLPLFCGSEGSLGIIIEADVKLFPKPEYTQIALFFYNSVYDAMKAVPELLETKPSAVELMDRNILELARQSDHFHLSVITESPGAILIVEHQVDKKETLMEMGAKIVTDDKAIQQEIWTTRKEGLGILMSMKQKRKPMAFIEDCAVPVDKLPEYVKRLDAILHKYNTEGAYYAHASAGCLHIRPLLDLGDPQDKKNMDLILDECIDILLDLGGTLTGEHGDGRSKGPYLERIFGKELVRAFNDVKNAFDPQGIFQLKGDTKIRHEFTKNEKKISLFRQEFVEEVQKCNGEGACRKKIGVMCPSFQATGDESLSTRGRANLLSAWLEGRDVTATLDKSLGSCLACKGCHLECPSQVDMAVLKSEYLHRRGAKLRDHFFARFDLLSKIGSKIGMPMAGLVKKMVGIHQKCHLPAPQKRFSRQYKNTYKIEECDAILFVDTHIEFYEPEIGFAAMEVFSFLDLKVHALYSGCCGRPAFSKGVLDHAKKQISQLKLPKEKPLIVVEPSCLSMLKDDASRLMDNFTKNKTFILLEDYILQNLDNRNKTKLQECKQKNNKLFFHAHCHQKAMRLSSKTKQLLELVADVELIVSGCCGMAGSFGYEKENYELSMKVAADRFIPELKKCGDNAIALPGRSCREMAERHDIKGHHPIIWVNKFIKNNEVSRSK